MAMNDQKIHKSYNFLTLNLQDLTKNNTFVKKVLQQSIYCAIIMKVENQKAIKHIR